MKNRLIVCMVAALAPFATASAPGKPYAIKTVVIDAGHGGHDTGCLGSSSKEKEVTLAIALKVGEFIEAEYPDIRVIYTRKNDRFVELHERAGIANRAKADLFICIHANSGNPAAFGTETYVMGLHKTDENLSVSRRENASVLLESDYKTKYDGFDPNSAEANIIFTLFQNAFMHQSLNFASKVQIEFEEYAGRYNRGVKQAGFLVLYRTSMPAVLIEAGFLSNRAEEKYLLSAKGENDISKSIFRAFKAYKVDMESMNHPSYASAQTKDIKPPPVTVKNPPAGEPDKSIANKSEIKQPDNSAVTTQASGETKKKSAVSPAPANKEPAGGLFYTVQIGATANGNSRGIEIFNVEDMKAIEGDDGYTRFTVGRYKDLNEAMRRQTELRKRGFKDAYVTPYHLGKRISLEEAAKIESKN